MRELKGDWKDLFNGFMLALDLRKMFLGLCAILFTLVPLAGTFYLAHHFYPAEVQRPHSIVLSDLCETFGKSFHMIYTGSEAHPKDWKIYVPHGIGFVLVTLAIWSFFGGAISRIAAYEIAKDGERLETNRALKFARRKFWSFFMAPFICAIGFGFFAFCNFAGGFIGRLLDFGWIGAPAVAILLPLALLSGFIMTLIVIGTVVGLPLFKPAVAAEGTDAFDAVSRGFSYIYSRPWHFLWYQAVTKAYGAVACTFVLLFAITLCQFGLKTGGIGFDAAFSKKAEPAAAGAPEIKNRFQDITNCAWSMILDKKCETCPCEAKKAEGGHGCCTKCPYTWTMYAAHRITGFSHKNNEVAVENLSTPHQVALWGILVWLILTLGMAVGYVPSYVFSQQTMIYYIMRKKVDGIEMNEVFEEVEEDEKPVQPLGGEGEKKDPVAK